MIASCQPFEGELADCTCDNTGVVDIGQGGGAVSGADEEDQNTGSARDFSECPVQVNDENECNPYCDLGCPDGQRCALDRDRAICVEIGASGVGQLCDTSADCGPNLSCFALSEDPGNRCYHMCINDSDCEGESRCDLRVSFSMSDDAESFTFCGAPSVGCDPFFDNPNPMSDARQQPGPGDLPGEMTGPRPNSGEGGTTGDGDGAAGALAGVETAAAGGDTGGVSSEDEAAAGVSLSAGSEQPMSGGISVFGGAQSHNDDVGGSGGVGGAGGAGGALTMEVRSQARMNVCEEGQGCYLNRDRTQCLEAGTKGAGEKCGQPNECQPGLHCLAVCTQVCSLDGRGDLPCSACPDVVLPDYIDAGQTVSNVLDSISPANDVGLCINDVMPAACDIYAQTGCDGEGVGCYLRSGGAACLPAGSGAAGTGCSSTNDCAPGNLCINDYCLPVCSQRSDVSANSQCVNACNGDFVNLRPVLWGLSVCTNVTPAQTCDFFAQDCSGNEVCVPTILGGEEGCVNRTGMLPEGMDCSAHSDCMAGLVCPPMLGACTPACAIQPGLPNQCDDLCDGNFQEAEQNSRVGYCPQ